MLRFYLKYFLLFALFACAIFYIQVYMVMEPITLYPKYALMPCLLVAIFSYIPARLEKMLQEEKSRKKSSETPQRPVLQRSETRSTRSRLKHDKLTGAISKDSFNEIIGFKIMEAKHIDSALSLIIFDIDYFKKINDTYGHLVGDTILKELSELIRNNLRESEYFVRWGGEEFVILLPGTSLQGAQMVAEKLRRAVEENTFSEVGKVTCSFGVTTLKEDDTIKSFLKRADEALYEAKNGGRNQVKVKI